MHLRSLRHFELVGLNPLWRVPTLNGRTLKTNYHKDLNSFGQIVLSFDTEAFYQMHDRLSIEELGVD